MVDAIESLGEVDSYGSRSGGWFRLVETLGDCGGEGEECSCGGVHGFEAVLGWVCWQRASEVRLDKFLKNLAGWTEKGYWAIRFTVFRVLVGFEDWDYYRCFPNGGNRGVLH